MTTQERIYKKLNLHRESVELSAERIELQKSTDELEKEVKKLSKELVQAEKLLRNGQTIAINIRRNYSDLLKDIERGINGYEDILKQGYGLLDNKAMSLIKTSLKKLKDARSIAKGRQGKAENISNAVKKALNR